MQTPRFKLYHYPATRSARVKWMLHEVLDDDFEIVPVYEQKDPRTIQRYREKFTNEAEPQLSKRFERHPFICGEAFTPADCVVGHTVIWARGYGLCRDEIFRGYISTLSKRPAFVKAFADVGGFQVEVPDGAELVERFTG